MTYKEFQQKLPSIERQLKGGEKKIVVIGGPQGPTGKTRAKSILMDLGIMAFEDYEVIHVELDSFLAK